MSNLLLILDYVKQFIRNWQSIRVRAWTRITLIVGIELSIKQNSAESVHVWRHRNVLV